MRFGLSFFICLILLTGCFRENDENFIAPADSASTPHSQVTLAQTRTLLATLSAANENGVSIVDVNPLDGDADDLRFFIYANSVVIAVADDHHVQTQNLALGNDSQGIYPFINLFPVIAELNGLLPRDSCFIIFLSQTSSPTPTVCAGKPIFYAEVSAIERFWYDEGNLRLRPVEVYGE